MMVSQKKIFCHSNLTTYLACMANITKSFHWSSAVYLIKHDNVYFFVTKIFIQMTEELQTRERRTRPKTSSTAAVNPTWLLSSPRAKRAGPKGLRTESARAVTGRRCPHSGKGEDFLSRQPNLFTETAVTPERKVEKSFPRWEINRHAKG